MKARHAQEKTSMRSSIRPVVIDDNSPSHEPAVPEPVCGVQPSSPTSHPKEADNLVSSGGSSPASAPSIGVKREREVLAGDGRRLKRPRIRRAPPPRYILKMNTCCIVVLFKTITDDSVCCAACPFQGILHILRSPSCHKPLP